MIYDIMRKALEEKRKRLAFSSLQKHGRRIRKEKNGMDKGLHRKPSDWNRVSEGVGT
jgi:hypothetical protein